MPSVTEKQQRFMEADLSRLRSGKATATGMNEKQLSDYATKPKRGFTFPAKKKSN